MNPKHPLNPAALSADCDAATAVEGIAGPFSTAPSGHATASDPLDGRMRRSRPYSHSPRRSGWRSFLPRVQCRCGRRGPDPIGSRAAEDGRDLKGLSR